MAMAVQPDTSDSGPERAARPGASDKYAEFWPRYLALHRSAGSRRLHYLGSIVGPAVLVWAILVGPLWLAPLAPVLGYGLAWLGHFLVEGNRPGTYGHPFWSLWSDYRMFGLWLTGRLAREYARHGLA